MKWKYPMHNPCFSDSHPQKYQLGVSETTQGVSAVCSKRNWSEATEHLLLPLVNGLLPPMEANLYSSPSDYAAHVMPGDTTPIGATVTAGFPCLLTALLFHHTSTTATSTRLPCLSVVDKVVSPISPAETCGSPGCVVN